MNMMDFKEVLDREGVIFSFSGTISQSILSSIAETIEKEMHSSAVSFSVVQNIFAVFTEQMQNIMSYSNERIHMDDNAFESLGICIVGYDKSVKHYYVCSANVISSEGIPRLSEKLDKIISLDKTALREYYKELRRSGKETHSRGAGLGFLEMAKKSSLPIQYNISKLDQNRSFFEIKVYI